MFKRKLIFIGMSVALFSLFFSHTVFADEKNDTEITKITTEEYEENIKDLNPISTDTLKEKINNNETFIVYFGRATCPYCRNLSPILKEFNEKIDKSLFYFNTEGKDNDEEMKKYIADELGISTVPTTLSFVDGNPVNGWVGDDTTVDKLYEVLVENISPDTSEASLNTSNEDSQTLKILLIVSSINLLVSILVSLLFLLKGFKK